MGSGATGVPADRRDTMPRPRGDAGRDARRQVGAATCAIFRSSLTDSSSGRARRNSLGFVGEGGDEVCHGDDVVDEVEGIAGPVDRGVGIWLQRSLPRGWADEPTRRTAPVGSGGRLCGRSSARDWSVAEAATRGRPLRIVRAWPLPVPSDPWRSFAWAREARGRGRRERLAEAAERARLVTRRRDDHPSGVGASYRHSSVNGSSSSFSAVANRAEHAPCSPGRSALRSSPRYVPVVVIRPIRPPLSTAAEC